MNHGEIISRETKKTFDTFEGETNSGEKLSAHYCDSELSVAKKWCSYCNESVSTESLGLLGHVICPKCKQKW